MGNPTWVSDVLGIKVRIELLDNYRTAMISCWSQDTEDVVECCICLVEELDSVTREMAKRVAQQENPSRAIPSPPQPEGTRDAALSKVKKKGA